MKLTANYHTHTTFCDGKDAPEQMVEAALELGFTHLGFSGHLDPDIAVDWPKYLAEVNRLKAAYSGIIEILAGVELDPLMVKLHDKNGIVSKLGMHKQRTVGRASTPLSPSDSGTPIDEPLRAAKPESSPYRLEHTSSPTLRHCQKNLKDSKRPYETLCPGAEYIIGSTHFLDKPQVDGRYLSVDSSPEELRLLTDTFFSGDFYRMAKSYFEFEASVFERTQCTFVGHFDLVAKFNERHRFFDETDPRYLGPALEAMEHLVRDCGLPFEINTGAIARGWKNGVYPSPMLLKALRDFGGEVLVSSDAHAKDQLGFAFDVALDSARVAGFDHVNILVRSGPGVAFRAVQL